MEDDGTILSTDVNINYYVNIGYYNTMAMGQDGKLYIGGIYRLENDGMIVPTGITSGLVYAMATGQDGKLYFSNNNYNDINNGILRLENDGTIVPTNMTGRTVGYFRSAATGQDGKLYIGGYSIGTGILRLDNVPVNTGKAVARVVTRKTFTDDTQTSEQDISLIPADMDEQTYVMQSDDFFASNAQQVIARNAQTSDYTVENEPITNSAGCNP